MDVLKTKLPEITDTFESLDLEADWQKAIEKQAEIVALLAQSSLSSGEKGDQLYKLAMLCYRKKAYTLAKGFAVEALALRKMFYGKKSRETLETVELASQIFKELEKTEPPRRKRRKKV
jgi:hypothetical protein